MGVILLLSEVWRRITFRYISDVRRRRQFLVLRRIVIGFCMGLVLILGFVSEFSSLARLPALSPPGWRLACKRFFFRSLPISSW